MNEGVQIPATLRGRIEFELIGRDGRTVQRGESENLILDAGLDALMAGTAQFSAMGAGLAVGTGTTAPAATDVRLAAEIARTSQTLGLITGTGVTRYGSGRFTAKTGVAFDYNQANGNLTEFGATNYHSSAIYTRALFKDGNGNPIVITKTSDTRLVIYYTLEIRFNPVVLTTGSINIDGIGTMGVQYLMVERNNPTWGYGCLSLFDYGYRGIQMNLAEMNMNQDSADFISDASYGGPAPYVNGTYTCTVSGERQPEQNDVTVYGYSLGYYYGQYYSQNQAQMKVKFDTPIVKGKDYRLKLSATYSISR